LARWQGGQSPKGRQKSAAVSQATARLQHPFLQEATMTRRFSTCAMLTLCVSVTLLATGCANLSHRQQNAAVGAGVGAVAGAVLTGGSTIGTLGGAAIGGAIGHGVDSSDGNRRR
jgi:osmotically inducible lipoprotein OsmB